MITANPNGYFKRADDICDCSLGNVLFTIAGVIGTAVNNNYSYGFKGWANQEFFKNKLPTTDNTKFRPYNLPANYKGFDVGFRGFDTPDNTIINGYFGSKHYFSHCEDLIRHYFEMEEICQAFKDCIIIHFRDYQKNPMMYSLPGNYYKNALKLLPEKKILVVTNDIDTASKILNIKADYTSNLPIVDFYICANADYFIASNSTFSWWGAYLSRAKTIVPNKWFDGDFKDCPVNLKDFYLDEWSMIDA
jgi:hypothetical protein